MTAAGSSGPTAGGANVPGANVCGANVCGAEARNRSQATAPGTAPPAETHVFTSPNRPTIRAAATATGSPDEPARAHLPQAPQYGSDPETGINQHRRGPGPERAEYRRGEPSAGADHQRDAIPRRHPGRRQAGGKAVRGGVKCAERQRVVLAGRVAGPAAGGEDRGDVGPLRRGPPQQLRNGPDRTGLGAAVGAGPRGAGR